MNFFFLFSMENIAFFLKKTTKKIDSDLFLMKYAFFFKHFYFFFLNILIVCNLYILLVWFYDAICNLSQRIIVYQLLLFFNCILTEMNICVKLIIVNILYWTGNKIRYIKGNKKKKYVFINSEVCFTAQAFKIIKFSCGKFF